MTFNNPVWTFTSENSPFLVSIFSLSSSELSMSEAICLLSDLDIPRKNKMLMTCSSEMFEYLLLQQDLNIIVLYLLSLVVLELKRERGKQLLVNLASKKSSAQKLTFPHLW